MLTSSSCAIAACMHSVSCSCCRSAALTQNLEHLAQVVLTVDLGISDVVAAPAQVWHYREADPDLGAWQAKELLDHLEGVLANEPVEVISGQSIVEVKPQVRGAAPGASVMHAPRTRHALLHAASAATGCHRHRDRTRLTAALGSGLYTYHQASTLWPVTGQGVSKGGMVEAILTAAARTGSAPDFVLCIGDDRSDEDMFTAMEHVTFSPHLPAEVRAACKAERSPHFTRKRAHIVASHHVHHPCERST
jgi:trehalose 6-phosphate synthase/phosphatase